MSEIKLENCSITKSAVGDYTTVYNSNNFDIDEALSLFITYGKQELKNADPKSKNYSTLNTALAFAQNKKIRELSRYFKQYSEEVWKNIFINVASSGILNIIKQIIAFADKCF